MKSKKNLWTKDIFCSLLLNILLLFEDLEQCFSPWVTRNPKIIHWFPKTTINGAIFCVKRIEKRWPPKSKFVCNCCHYCTLSKSIEHSPSLDNLHLVLIFICCPLITGRKMTNKYGFFKWKFLKHWYTSMFDIGNL